MYTIVVSLSEIATNIVVTTSAFKEYYEHFRAYMDLGNQGVTNTG